MKTTTALFLLSIVSSSSVLSTTASPNNADELNFNLRHSHNIELLESPQNKHQCYNHCQRHNGKPKQWIDKCKADCDAQYDPKCYNQGDYCERDEDCLTGGYNPCNKCGQKGTQFANQCYSDETPEPTEAPTPSPLQCNTYGEDCERDEDCMGGGFNPCTKCGQKGTLMAGKCYGGLTEAPTPSPLQCNTYGDECKTDDDCMKGGFNPCTKCGAHGTRMAGLCYGGDEDVMFIEDDGDGVDWDAGNWTEKTADGTKKAAETVADGTKKAAQATYDWGKRTFDPNSSSIKSSSMTIAAGVAAFVMLV